MATKSPLKLSHNLKKPRDKGRCAGTGSSLFIVSRSGSLARKGTRGPHSGMLPDSDDEQQFYQSLAYPEPRSRTTRSTPNHGHISSGSCRNRRCSHHRRCAPQGARTCPREPKEHAFFFATALFPTHTHAYTMASRRRKRSKKSARRRSRRSYRGSGVKETVDAFFQEWGKLTSIIETDNQWFLNNISGRPNYRAIVTKLIKEIDKEDFTKAVPLLDNSHFRER